MTCDKEQNLAKWFRLWLESYVDISKEENQMFSLITHAIPLHIRKLILDPNGKCNQALV
jgi:hypothetical protein